MGITKLEKPRRMNFSTKDRARILHPTFNLTRGEGVDDGTSVKDLADKVTAHVKAAAQVAQDPLAALIPTLKEIYGEEAYQQLSQDPQSVIAAVQDALSRIKDPGLKNIATHAANELGRVLSAHQQSSGIPGQLEIPLTAIMSRIPGWKQIAPQLATSAATAGKDWLMNTGLYQNPEFIAATRLLNSSLATNKLREQALQDPSKIPEYQTKLQELEQSAKSVQHTSGTTPSPTPREQALNAASGAYFTSAFPAMSAAAAPIAATVPLLWGNTEGLTRENLLDQPARALGSGAVAKSVPSLLRSASAGGKALPVVGSLASLYTSGQDIAHGLSTTGQSEIQRELSEKMWRELANPNTGWGSTFLSTVGDLGNFVFSSDPSARPKGWARVVSGLEGVAPETFQGLSSDEKAAIQSAFDAKVQHKNTVKADLQRRLGTDIDPATLSSLADKLLNQLPTVEQDIAARFPNTSAEPSVVEHHRNAVRDAAYEAAFRQTAYKDYYAPLQSQEYAKPEGKADFTKLRTLFQRIYPESGKNTTDVENFLGAGMYGTDSNNPAKQLSSNERARLLTFGRSVGDRQLLRLLVTPKLDEAGNVTDVVYHPERALTFAQTTYARPGESVYEDLLGRYPVPQEALGSLGQLPESSDIEGARAMEYRKRRLIRDRADEQEAERLAESHTRFGQQMADAEKAQLADRAKLQAFEQQRQQLLAAREERRKQYKPLPAEVTDRMKSEQIDPDRNPVPLYARPATPSAKPAVALKAVPPSWTPPKVDAVTKIPETAVPKLPKT
jgi:hypothetical protein